ncbi:MAG TPA: LysR family transcriptional regulator [Actinokineospora sp.]|nr:LysR family transcriptional regulator [Actinokineospora sp.]
MRIEARHLRLLLAVAEAGGLRQAAVSMNLSQPVLRLRLQRVEQALGGALFRRDGDTMTPTELGHRFLRGAAELMTDLDVIQERAAAMARPAADLRVGATMTVLLEDLIEIVRDLRPGRRVYSQTGSTESLVARVADGTVDYAVAIHYGEGAMGPTPGVSTRTLVEAEPAFVGLAADHPMAGHAELDLADLADEEWIVTSPNDRSGRYDSFVKACAQAGFAPRTGHDVAEWDTMTRLIRAGHGIGLVTPLWAAPRGLVYRPIKGDPQHRDLILCWPSGASLAHRAEEVWTGLRTGYLAAVARIPHYKAWWEQVRGPLPG